MKQHHHAVDYSRYFTLKQRAYLINMSEERDREHFESLSGIIVHREGSSITLQVPYPTEQESPAPGSPRQIYKLTSEAMGSGIQILADLVRVEQGQLFHLQLHGNLEMYQRRQTPRVDTEIGFFQIRRDVSLAVYRREFRRIVDYIKTQGLPPNLKFQQTKVNLSAGGLCLALPESQAPSPLALFFLDLQEGQPVCAVAELIWSRLEEGQRRCGHRFVHIHKADQERIKHHVLGVQKEQGLTVGSTKTSWELLDRMTTPPAPAG